MSGAKRLFAGIIALLALAAVLAQTYVFHAIVAEKGGGWGVTLWVAAGYFTLITNSLIGVAFGLIAGQRWSPHWPSQAALVGCLALNALLVGAVYHTLLSGLWAPVGLHWWADLGLHSVVPGLVMVYWLALVSGAGLVLRHAVLWMMYPSGYFVYALARGALDGWYPYPFLDVGVLGYGRVILNAGGIALALVVAGAGLVMLKRALPGGSVP